MLSQTQNTTAPFGKIVYVVTVFLLLGITVLLLIAFQGAIEEYHGLIFRLLAFCAVVVMLSMTAYLSVSIFLSLEYRVIENEIFKESRQQLIAPAESEPKSELDRKILDLYHEMTATNSLSLNQLALEVYGKKGGFYNNQIREILQQYHIEI